MEVRETRYVLPGGDCGLPFPWGWPSAPREPVCCALGAWGAEAGLLPVPLLKGHHAQAG